MSNLKLVGNAVVSPIVNAAQKKELAKNLNGITHITYNDLKKTCRSYLHDFTERIILERMFGDEKLGEIAHGYDLNARKLLVKRIAGSLKEKTGVTFEWKEADVEKIGLDGLVNNMKAQLRTAMANDMAIHDSKKFEEGDKIYMNKGADGEYQRTRKGSEGEVIEDAGDGNYTVRFTKLTGNPEPVSEIWPVNKKYMERRSLKKLAKKDGDAETFASQFVHNIVTEVIVNNERDGFLDSLIAELIGDKFLIKMNNDTYGISQNRMFELLGGNLAAAYANPRLYTTPDMFSPPAERKPHVLRLELTQGCDHNACTYCGGYKDISYKEKTHQEFVEHYYAVRKSLGDHIERIRRLFIGCGNALSVDIKVLEKSIRFLERELNPRRISIYGRTDAIKNKGRTGLSELRNCGLGLIYWGAESGSSDVLKYVCKKTTPDEMLLAGYATELAGINLSIMVMPGLGGIKYSQSHIDGTVRFLNEVKTRYVTFMAINVAENSVYAQRMAEEVRAGTNRPLTQREIVEQMGAIIGDMAPKGNKVGMFDQTIDQVGYNPISFNVEFNEYGKRDVLAICNNYLRETS